MRFSFVAAAIAANLLAACSAIPDQADLSGIDTVDIINNIRCEAHDVLVRYPAFGPKHDFILAMTFDFDTEANKGAGGTTTLAIPVPLGTFTVGLDGGVEKTRYGEEKVSLAEAFSELSLLDCSRLRAPRELAYPITGSVGLGDAIDKYLELKSLPKAKISDYFRTLRFTVKLSGGINPKWALVRSSGTKIDANLDLGADRTDTHELKITITPNTKKTKKELIEEKTVYVRILDGKTRALIKQEIEELPTPTDYDNAKDRAMRDLREDRSVDIYERIERKIEPAR